MGPSPELRFRQATLPHQRQVMPVSVGGMNAGLLESTAHRLEIDTFSVSKLLLARQACGALHYCEGSAIRVSTVRMMFCSTPVCASLWYICFQWRHFLFHCACYFNHRVRMIDSESVVHTNLTDECINHIVCFMVWATSGQPRLAYYSSVMHSTAALFNEML